MFNCIPTTHLSNMDISLLSLANEYINQLKFHTGPIRQQLVDLSIAILKTFIHGPNNANNEVLIESYLSLSTLIVIEDTSKRYMLDDETAEIIQNGILLSQRRGLVDKECEFAILSVRVSHYKGNTKNASSTLKDYCEKLDKLIEREVEIEFAKLSSSDGAVGADYDICQTRKLIPISINYLYLLIFLGIELFPNNPICSGRLKSLQEKKFLDGSSGNQQVQHIINSLNNRLPPLIQALSYIIRMYLLIKSRKLDEVRALVNEFESNDELTGLIHQGNHLQLSTMYYLGRLLHKIYYMFRSKTEKELELEELLKRFQRLIELVKERGERVDRIDIPTQGPDGFEFSVFWTNFGFHHFSNVENLENLGLFIVSIVKWMGGCPEEAAESISEVRMKYDQRILANCQLPLDGNDPVLGLIFSVKWIELLTKFNPNNPDVAGITKLVDEIFTIFDEQDAKNEHYLWHMELLEGLYLQMIVPTQNTEGQDLQVEALGRYIDIMESANTQFLQLPTTKERQKFVAESANSELIVYAIIEAYALLGPDDLGLQDYREYVETYNELYNNPAIIRLWYLVTIGSARVINEADKRGEYLKYIFETTNYNKPPNTTLPPNLTDLVSYYLLAKYDKRRQLTEGLSKYGFSQAPKAWQLLFGRLLESLYRSRGELDDAETQKTKNVQLEADLHSWTRYVEVQR